MPQKRGSQLIREWGIPCDYGLYSDWGNFYAPPRQFPVALIDSKGFVIFDRQEDLIAQGAAIGKRLNVPARISSLPGYQFRRTGGPGLRLPEELTGIYWEGVSAKVSVNRYEREPRARVACLEHYGHRCCGCGFLMPEKYGARAEGLIHVHHLIPLANIGEEYEIDPIKDLRPVCPNCHAVIHYCDPPLSLEELAMALRAQKGSSI
jgi:HNH endonuclease